MQHATELLNDLAKAKRRWTEKNQLGLGESDKLREVPSGPKGPGASFQVG